MRGFRKGDRKQKWQVGSSLPCTSDAVNLPKSRLGLCGTEALASLGRSRYQASGKCKAVCRIQQVDFLIAQAIPQIFQIMDAIAAVVVIGRSVLWPARLILLLGDGLAFLLAPCGVAGEMPCGRYPGCGVRVLLLPPVGTVGLDSTLAPNS